MNLAAEPRPTLFSGRLKRRCNGGDTVTETVLHVVTPLPWPIEPASMSVMKRLTARLLIVVGACGAFGAETALQRWRHRY